MIPSVHLTFQRLFFLLPSLVPVYAVYADSNVGPSCFTSPSLVFFQPPISAGDVDAVVLDNDGAPAENRLRVRNDWLGPNSDTVPLSWDVGNYTGFSPNGGVSNFQRGHDADAGTTAVQAQDGTIGLWFNSRDLDPPKGNGSLPDDSGDTGSMTIGCWTASPERFVFGPATERLEVSFDLHVHHDATYAFGINHGVAFVKVNLFFNDSQGEGVILSVVAYDKRGVGAIPVEIHGDLTGTTTAMPIADVALSDNALARDGGAWISKAPTSESFQEQPYPDAGFKHFAFYVTRETFQNLVNNVRQVTDGGQAYASDISQYKLTHFGLAVEGVDKNLLSQAQLGVSVEKFRIVAHAPAADPYGYAGSTASRIVHWSGSSDGGHIYESSGSPDAWVHWDMTSQLHVVPSVSKPMGYFSGRERVVYRSSDGHVRELSLGGGGWEHRDITAEMGAGPAVGNPMGYGSNGARVVYRGEDHHIHEALLSSSSWVHRDLTAEADAGPATGDPRGHGGDAPRVVYTGANGHLYEFSFFNGGWRHWNMTAGLGAVPAEGEPWVYSTGNPRVVYRGADSHVHELSMYPDGGWIHWDMTAGLDAGPVAGNPMGYSGGAPRVVYRGTDSHIHEFSMYPDGGWVHWDMTAGLDAGQAAGDPMGFSAGTPQVVYRTLDGGVSGFFLDGGQWQHAPVYP